MDFLCDSNNRTEFSTLLTDKITKFYIPASKLVYVTSGKSVLHSGSANSMPDYNHEEADTRIVVLGYAKHTLQQDMKTIEI